jgi:glycosyltransferase involved in cell wall biosynthesis
MKPLFIISCPIDCYSGYSSRSRDLVKAIIELDKYDVKILPQRWGGTPWGFIEDNPEWKFLEKHILPNGQIPRQPEIWAQVTIPNEFQPIGKFNIGFTAGIETTVCNPTWIDGLNKMDLNIVSSKHAKDVFLNAKFEERNQQTNQVVRQIKLEKPVEILFEGVDLQIYKLLDKLPQNELFNHINSIPESFAYLYLGAWIQGDFGEDRKNTSLLVKAFYETFKNKKQKPALILKTSGVGSSYMDRDMILDKIYQIKKTVNSKDLPNIYLLHGEFSDAEINEIYNHPKVKAMVSLTKGEGFGRPLLEFTQCKKPVITTNWSGHTDFLDPQMSILLGGQLTPVHPSVVNDWIIKDSQWFSVDHGQVGHYLRDVFENYKNYTDRAKRQAYKSKTEFSWDKMKEKLNQILEGSIPEFPSQVQLKLPSLKKIELPKLKKVETNG